MISDGISGLKTFFFQSRRMKLFLVWFLFVVFLLFVWVVGDSANDRTVAISAVICGGSTFLFWSYRTAVKRITLFWSSRKKFVFLGSLGAVWVEFVFWLFEKLCSAQGVAASPNLILDLLATMPWYIMMLFLLYRVETTYSYSYTEILLLGGIYELGADGIFGQIMEGLTVASLFLVVMVIPLFVIVYSFIVLPPTYLLREEITEIRREQPQRTHKYRYALLPLLGLIPYFGFGFLFLL